MNSKLLSGILYIKMKDELVPSRVKILNIASDGTITRRTVTIPDTKILVSMVELKETE